MDFTPHRTSDACGKPFGFNSSLRRETRLQDCFTAKASTAEAAALSSRFIAVVLLLCKDLGILPNDI
ncbi:MAG: hypothetical protein ACRAVC_02740 [Trichormus sp.]